jgi:hypothetical protein
MISRRGTDTELGPEEVSLAWAAHGSVGVEAVGQWSSCSGWIETETSAPLSCLNGGLLLLLLLLLLDLLS